MIKNTTISYAQTTNGKTQYGLNCWCFVDDYTTGNIKRHELTRRDKEEDRKACVCICNANVEPVFLCLPSDNEVP